MDLTAPIFTKQNLTEHFFVDILYTEKCLNRNKDVEHSGKIGLWS
jgi:hypothetical protein